MIKGKTRTGFYYTITDETLDDWELLEILRKIDDGNPHYLVDAAKKLLGDKQYTKLKNHIKKTVGRVSATVMQKELDDIMQTNKKVKN